MNQTEQQRKIDERRIEASATILDALKLMDLIDRKLLLVFDGPTFLGLVSVGDIQRTIIANKPLDTIVREVLRPNIKVGKASDDFVSIRKHMIRYRTECMPMVDEHGNLTDVIFWEDIFPEGDKRVDRSLNLPVVIMAGGKGVRMKPFTNIFPKPLLPLDNKTVIEHIMDRFVAIGCDTFMVSVNYKAEFIKYYLGSLSESPYKIEYFQEEKPLGTIGSLYLIKKDIQSTFFVSNCDILIDQDYGEIYDYHKEHNNELTMVAALKHIKIPYGTIEPAEGGQLISLVEKPELTFKINSGLYILEPHLLQEIPTNEFFHITELINVIIKRGGKVGVFPVSENSWKDIGEWGEYMQVSKTFHESHSMK